MNKKICFIDTDPRAVTDPKYKTNMGSFSIVADGFNKGLKEIGCYAEPDEADFVGICDALNVGFRYKNKKIFILNVWDTINSLPTYLTACQKHYKPIMFGLSDQITRLWRENGVRCETAMPGCDIDFWKPDLSRRDSTTTFLFNSFANVRSGLDLAIEAFSKAFSPQDNVRLIIKNTESNEKLEYYINSVIRRKVDDSSLNTLDIQYITGRSSFEEMRSLYQRSHFSLNVMRMSSWGLGIHESVACGCIPIVGNFTPSNVIVEGLSAFVLDPTEEIDISLKVPELEMKGLHNAYGNFDYRERPRFYDYSIYDYAELLRNCHQCNVRSSPTIEREKLKNKWSWSKAAKNISDKLNELT